jgi:hypothetical protein
MEVFQVAPPVEVLAQVRGELLGEGVQDLAADQATEGSTIISVMKQRAKHFCSGVDHDGDSHYRTENREIRIVLMTD